MRRIRSERAASGLLAVVVNDCGDVVADPQAADELAPDAQVVQLGLAGAVAVHEYGGCRYPGMKNGSCDTSVGAVTCP